MSFFAASFGIPADGWLAAMQRGFADLLGVDQAGEVATFADARLLHGGCCRFTPKVHCAEGVGWVVCDGIAVDVRSSDGRPSLDQFLADTVAAGKPDVDRYEGAFSIALWDATRSVGWFFNDHASCRNLYYCHRAGAAYITTAPVVLAKALGLQLDEFGVRQLLARGCVLAPTSMFEALNRVSIGEVGRFSHGSLAVTCDWLPCREPMRGSVDESANAVAAVLTDRVRRLSVVAEKSVADLTGGFDSRLVNLARHFVGVPVDVMVNGPEASDDVRIAKKLAAVMGWPLRHYQHDDERITGPLRQELSNFTAGELPFDRISFHRRTRPELGAEYDVALNGVGGELLRYYTWSHEFANIGRRRRADVDRTLRYRYTLFGEPPPMLFVKPWFDEFQSRIAEMIGQWFDRMPDTLTTQQQDALYVWKMTSHGSLWTSATSQWLPNVSPLMTRGCLDVMVAVPWRQKVTSRLQRTVNHWLSPRGASVATAYGASGGRWGIRDLPGIVGQTCHQGAKLAEKLIRVLRRKGRLTMPYIPPYITEEFCDFLTPESMVTGSLYDADGLRNYVAGSNQQLAGRAVYLARIATIECVARAIS